MNDPNARLRAIWVLLSGALVTAACYSATAFRPEGEWPRVSRSAAEKPSVDGLTPAQRLWRSMDEAEKNGRYDEALALNDAIRARHGDLYLVNFRAGRLHALKQDFASAAEAYRRAAAMSPKALAPLNGMAACYVAMGKSDLALKTSLAVLTIDPMNATATRRVAELHVEAKEPQAAEAYYLKLLAAAPEDLDLGAQYAWCLLAQGKTDQARAVFGSILVAAPGHASSLAGWNRCNLPITPERNEEKP